MPDRSSESNRIMSQAVIILGGLLFIAPSCLAAASYQPTPFTEWLSRLGWGGPLALGLLVALEVLFAPIPGWALAMAAGFLYGAWGGTLITWAGAMVGSIAAFWLARHFGRHRLVPYIPQKLRARFDHISQKEGFIILLAARVLPFTALDVLSYAAGLSRMSLWSFLAASALGFIPGTVALVAVGAQAAQIPHLNEAVYLAIIVYIAVRGGVYLYRRYKDGAQLG